MKSEKVWPVVGLALAVAGLAWYFTLLVRHLDAAAAGPDSSGYMNEARLIASGRVRMVIEPLRTLGLDDSYGHLFTPFGFMVGRNGTMVPTYPAGAPIHLAIAALLGGWNLAPFLVGPLAAIGTLVLMYVVGRQLELASWLSAAGAAALAAAPVMITHAVQPVSDVLATFWALAAISAALRANEKRGFALIAGAAFGIGVWVRPTNFLMALPLAFALRWRPSRLLPAVAAALPFGVGLMLLNADLYGNPLRTGYGSLIDVLSWHALRKGFPLYITWIRDMLTPLVFPVGLFVVLDRRVDPWLRWLLAVWFAVFFIFYCLYDINDGWWCTRFLLPAFPPLILGTLLVMRDLLPLILGRRRPWLTVGAALVLIAIILRMQVTQNKVLETLEIGRIDTTYPLSVAWAGRQLPGNALVATGLMSGAFFYYQNRFTIRWDQMDNDSFQLMRAYALNAGLQWYALLSDVEIKPADFPKRFQGQWTAMGRFRDVTLWRLEH
jgi:hypothetical protein